MAAKLSSRPLYSPEWEQRLTVVPQIQVTRNCNLACEYCFQEHSGGIIDLGTVETILRRVVAHNLACEPHNKIMQIYWHGGEPLLAGVDFFGAVVRLEAQYPEIAFENRVQTNGTLMNAELAEFFVEHGFQVGFSLDGPQEIHDRYRKWRGSGSGSFDAARRGLECYRHYSTAEKVPVIAVVTRASCGRAGDLFAFFKALGADVQLDIYDVRWRDLIAAEAAGLPSLAPSPPEVGHFLMELFDRWFYDPERRVDFRELRQEVKMVLQPEIDRGDPLHKKRCDFRRLIFAPDGWVFSCDQWLNDAASALGHIHRDSLALILRNKARRWAEIKRRLRRSGKDMACGVCEWGRQCGGGCLTCMKYNALLWRARAARLPDRCWAEAVLPPAWEAIRGETYYCEGLGLFRHHVREAVRRELADAG